MEKRVVELGGNVAVVCKWGARDFNHLCPLCLKFGNAVTDKLTSCVSGRVV